MTHIGAVVVFTLCSPRAPLLPASSLFSQQTGRPQYVIWMVYEVNVKVILAFNGISYYSEMIFTS